jgi:ABC-type polysaccharide/polyol phosphate export permease
LRTILSLNPMAPILESYRNVIYGEADASWAAPDFIGLAIALAFSLVLILVGIVLFKRMEPAFAKVV